tara:strand:+ start:14235 stop:14633 length:399 start_codon:yes stop_codon:yes gene_type:complete
MADIGDFGVIQGSKPLVLLNPKTDEELINDEGKKMTIYLYGLDSKIAKTASREIKADDREGKKISSAEQDRRMIDLLARITDRFENLSVGGKCPSNDHESAFSLYKKYPWIETQIIEFIGIRSNHLGNSQEG